MAVQFDNAKVYTANTVPNDMYGDEAKAPEIMHTDAVAQITRAEIEELTVQIGNIIDRRRAAYADGRCTGAEKREIIAAAKEALEAAQTLYEDAKHVKVDD